MTDASEEDYYAAVEKHFVALRGSPLFITPHEWQLVHRWREEEIPLRVVREALDVAVERAQRKPRNRAVKLSYCRPTVDARFRRFREALVGASSIPEREVVSPDLGEYLGKLGRDLAERGERLRASEAELARVLARSAVRLVEISRGPFHFDSLRDIERALDELESELIAAAERVIGQNECEACRREAEGTLEDYRARMPSDVFRSAVQSAYVKRLRSRFQLPSLSLFNL